MRTGDWIATYTGTKFFVTDPAPEDVKIEDIAHALSLICRYGGHSVCFYSVAQHSVHVFEIVRETYPQRLDFQIHALMHDASEAYLGDVVRPLKRSLSEYRAYEQTCQCVIQSGLDMPLYAMETDRVVKWADDIALMTERRDLMNHQNLSWNIAAEPHGGRITPLSPTSAEALFLAKYRSLRAAMEAYGS